MSQGRILQLGTPTEIYETPNCRFVADFIGNVNLLEGTLTTDEVGCSEISTAQGVVRIGHGISGQLGMHLAAGIRPEKISISLSAPAQSHNVVQGVVKEIAYMGSYSTFVVALPDGYILRATQANRSRNHEDDLSWGQQVHCWWDQDAVVVLQS